MSKRFFNILSIVFSVLFLLIVFTPDVYAGSMPNPDELQSQASGFINKGQSNSKIDVNKIANIMKPLASLLLGIGTVVLVVVTAVIAVKYMAATPDMRAQLKKQLVGIVVSAIVLYGAYGIWSIAYTVMNNITK